jgi:hypothetical protein
MKALERCTQSQYHMDHLIAKIIIYLGYVLIGIVSIELDNPYLALGVGTYIWLFGVNSVAYIIECVSGHAHVHNPL